METLKAQLLVASPQLPDDNFYRSVVLLIHQDEEGAFGVVLNRPTNFPLKEVWYAITEKECDFDSPIHMGGPVEGPLVAIHEREDIAENEILPGVYISSEKENLELLFDDKVERCKILSGYSGWGPDQLEAEMETGSWLKTEATKEDIFSENENLWEDVVDRIGQQILFQGSHRGLAKFDPSLN